MPVQCIIFGIALGDCFGQSFFIPDEMARQSIKNRELLNEPWHFTDDTVMAIGIYHILEKYGEINQDALARTFAENYALDWPAIPSICECVAAADALAK